MDLIKLSQVLLMFVTLILTGENRAASQNHDLFDWTPMKKVTQFLNRDQNSDLVRHFYYHHIFEDDKKFNKWNVKYHGEKHKYQNLDDNIRRSGEKRKDQKKKSESESKGNG